MESAEFDGFTRFFAVPAFYRPAPTEKLAGKNCIGSLRPATMIIWPFIPRPCIKPVIALELGAVQSITRAPRERATVVKPSRLVAENRKW
jgi:hypothetical protein